MYFTTSLIRGNFLFCHTLILVYYKNMYKKIVCILLIGIFLWTNSASALITIEEEKKMGEKFFAEVKSQIPLISDPVLNRYYNEIGQTLVAHLKERYYPYYFFIIDDSTLNAFAAPGGYVFIYRGLFLAFDTEDELAAVTAHEMGHVVCRHIAKRIEKSKKIGIATMIAILAGAFMGLDAGAIATTAMGAGMAMSFKYSREDEEQADRTGLNILLASGYDGKAVVSSFKKLLQFSLGSGGKIPPYLKTHPDLEVRIVYIANTLKRISPPKKKHHDQRRFKLMQARLRALYTETEAAKNFFALKLRQDPKDAVSHYGLALCFMRERDWKKAIIHLKQALDLKPAEPLFWRALGICYTEKEEFTLALRYLKKVNQDAEVAFYLGLAYEHNGNIDKAIKIWQSALEKFDPHLTLNLSDFSQICYHLAHAFAKKKKLDWAHYYLGKYFELEGKPAQARYHFQKAKNLTQDKALKVKIGTNIKEPKKEDKK